MTDRERRLEWQPMERFSLPVDKWTHRDPTEGIYTIDGKTMKRHTGETSCPYCLGSMVQVTGKVVRIGHIVSRDSERWTYLGDRLRASHVALFCLSCEQGFSSLIPDPPQDAP